MKIRNKISGFILTVFLLVTVVGQGQKSYIDSLKTLLPLHHDDSSRMDIFYKLAKSYRNLNPYIGLDYADSCYQLSLKLNDKAYEAKITNETGVLYRKVDMYEQAIDQHQKALIAFEKLHDKMGISFTYANLGNVFLTIGQLDKALEYNQKSLRLKYELGDSLQIAYSLRTTALAFQALQQYDSALIYLNKARDIYDVYGDDFDIGNINYHIGSVYLESGKNENLALLYLGKALKAYTKLESDYGTSVAKYEVGKTYFKLGEFKIAKQYFDDALATSRKANTRKVIMDIYRDYSKLFKQAGDYKNALVYFEKYAVLRDSLFTEASNKNIAEMQAKYKSDEQQDEITLLRKENEIINNERKLKSAYLLLLILGIVFISSVSVLIYLRNRTNAKINRKLEAEITIKNQKEQQLKASEKQLKEVNTTKDKFFSIISHDLKSPFGALLGLTELLEDEYDDMDHEERLSLVRQIRKASGNTYTLLMDLLVWSQSQRGSIEYNPTNINVTSICKENSDYISSEALKKKIRIKCNVPKELMAYADYNMFTTVVRNLLSNAIKFSYPGGEVNIGAELITEKKDQKSYVRIKISDQGVGIKKKHIPLLFKLEEKIKTPGTANETGTGLGLIICKEFIEKQGGTVEVESEEGKGSTFSFTLPAVKQSPN